jgi:molybdopterin molybdotransferase
MPKTGPAIALEEALAIVDRALSTTILPHRVVAVRDAVGHTLAADQRSRLELPPFDKSTVDGYAIADGDACDRYQVLESVAAGGTPVTVLRPGAAVKVMTGAPVPTGAGRVLPIEHVQNRGGMIEVTQPADGRNICRRGEDLRPGDVLLRAGARLSAVEIACLIGSGITEVEVFRPVRLAVFSTGDEIVDHPQQLGPGKIMNTNGPLLALLGRRFAMDVVIEESLADNRAATATAVARALGQAELVVMSGGVSVGDHDYVGSALSDAGLDTHFSAVAVKPGRPLTFATRPGKAVFGLPGNPVAAYVTFHLFVLRAAAQLCRSPWPLGEITLSLGQAFDRRNADRVDYVPCRVGADSTLAPVEFHGSAHLAALAQSEGFMVVPGGTLRLEAGARVRFLPVPKGWR